MKNLKDNKSKIHPSTTRGGEELPSSSALDSPFVMSKFATPTPAIDSNMSHVIDDVTSAMRDGYGDTTSLLDNTVPLGEFLDEQLARVREMKLQKLMILLKLKIMILPLDMNCLLYLRVILWMMKLLETSFLAMIDMILRTIS